MSNELVPWREADRRRARVQPLQMLVGFARVAAGTWVRTAAWSLGASYRLARSPGDPQVASELTRDVVDTLRGLVRELLGVSDLSLDERIKRLLPPAAEPVGARGDDGHGANVASLRRQGAELLRQAADVDLDDSTHPAYARILLELAPDEARILRLLATEGPQPAVDVQETQLIGSGKVIADGLNMVGAAAGCRYPDRIPAYLNNLIRLGFIRHSREPLEDPITYQVLEAQPSVLEAVRRASRARTLQRSIRLTPFGVDFCEICLPLEGDQDGRTRGPR